MHTTTLKDVFPEPSKYHSWGISFKRWISKLILEGVYRRNFIKENVKSIKQMQGFLMEAGVIQPRQGRSDKRDKFQNVPVKEKFIRSGSHSSHTRIRSTSGDRNEHKTQAAVKHSTKKMGNSTTVPTKLKNDKNNKKPGVQDKFTERSMQTERNEDLVKLYETGIIKYPSPGIATTKSPTIPRKADSIKARGDVPDDIDQDLQSLCKY